MDYGIAARGSVMGIMRKIGNSGAAILSTIDALNAESLILNKIEGFIDNPVIRQVIRKVFSLINLISGVFLALNMSYSLITWIRDTLKKQLEEKKKEEQQDSSISEPPASSSQKNGNASHTDTDVKILQATATQ